MYPGQQYKIEQNNGQPQQHHNKMPSLPTYVSMPNLNNSNNFQNNTQQARYNAISHFSSQFDSQNTPKMGRELSPDTAYPNGQAPSHHGKNKSVTESFFDSFDVMDDAKSSNNDNNNKNGGRRASDKQKRNSGHKARQEIEVRWTCPLCTYHNNMLMSQCELCGTLKPDNPITVQKAVLDSPVPQLDSAANSAVDDDDPFDALSDFSASPMNITSNKNDSSDNKLGRMKSVPHSSQDVTNIYQYYNSNVHFQNNQKNKNNQNTNNNSNASQLHSSWMPQSPPKTNHRKSQSDTKVVIKNWTCAVCTFAGNPIDHPVCKICGALPPTRPPTPEPQPVPSPDKKRKEQSIQQSIQQSKQQHHRKKSSQEKLMEMHQEQERYLRQLSKSHEMDEANGGGNGRRDSLKMEDMPSVPSDENENDNDNIHKSSMDPLEAAHRNSISQIMVKDASRTNSKPNTPQVHESSHLQSEHVSNGSNGSNEESKTEDDGKSSSPEPKSKVGVFGRAIVSVKQKVMGSAQKTSNRDRTRSDVSERDRSSLVDRFSSGAGSSGGDRSRSKSRERPRGKSHNPPFEKANTEEFEKVNSQQKNISVADIPAKQSAKIKARLNGLTTKPALDKELQTSMNKLKKKLENHASNVMKYQTTIKYVAKEKVNELQLWRTYYIVEMQQYCLEYFDNKLMYLHTCIEIERLHTECYKVKLQKLESAQKNIKKNHKKYTIDEIRNTIEGAFNTAWRIRLSDDVKDKQDFKKELNKIVEECKRTYKIKKETYPAEIPFEQRKEKVILFLRSALNHYESMQQSENKGYTLKNDLKNEENFFYPYNRTEQIQFDSFILDQRTKEGRIVNKWLQFIKKKEKQISIQDIADFEKKLSHTFCHTYDLNFNKYYECIRIFVYRCILRRKVVRQIVENVLETNFTEMQQHDQLFQKKTFWMRSLKYDKLGINGVYWFDPTMDSNNTILASLLDYNSKVSNSNKNDENHKMDKMDKMDSRDDSQMQGGKHKRMATNESDLLDLDGTKADASVNYDSGDDGDSAAADKNNGGDLFGEIDYPSAIGTYRKRASQIGYVAGSGVPFADAINLIGQLEPSNSPAAIRAAMEKAKQKEMESKTGTNHATNDLLKDEGILIDSDDISLAFTMPDEGLYILLNAVKCIHETAMKYFRFNKQISDLNDSRNGSNSQSMSMSANGANGANGSIMDTMDSLIDNLGQKMDESKMESNDKKDKQPMITRVQTEKQYIGSDDLFPIVVYCVIQSKLETPHRFIEFVEAILPSEKTKMGQAAFALSVLKAAVEYIIQRKPTDFGLDAEIEF